MNNAAWRNDEYYRRERRVGISGVAINSPVDGSNEPIEYIRMMNKKLDEQLSFSATTEFLVLAMYESVLIENLGLSFDINGSYSFDTETIRAVLDRHNYAYRDGKNMVNDIVLKVW
ncbi:hypothetical protein [Bacillus bombysepticus]|uniref:hypothetical protein n=1 Tax=Bacillus bombysepticus TaxID=658666 RepID=UPI0030180F32